MKRIAAAGLFAVLFAAAPAQAQLAVGMRLENAGFKMKEANTPRKLERLRSVPKHTFIARKKNGVPYYLYADPDYCKCAFIGDQTAMNAYRAMPKGPQQPDNVGPGGVSVVNEMENEMAVESGTDFDDIFHPGF